MKSHWYLDDIYTERNFIPIEEVKMVTTAAATGPREVRFSQLNLKTPGGNRSIQIPESVAAYLRGSVLTGVPVYCVGGTARDLLLGRTPNDWDLFVGMPRERVAGLPGAVEMGNATDTILVNVERGLDLEITSLKLETQARAAVERDLREERDLTINSIAIDLMTGEIIDPLDGMRDLEEGIIRFAGDGQQRIDSSPIRPLRACRFAAVLQFRIAPESLDLIRRNASRIGEAESQGIKRELDRILRAADPALALEAMTFTGLWAELLKEVGITQKLTGSREWSLIRLAGSFLIRQVIMLREMGYSREKLEELDAFLKYYDFSNEESSNILKLIRALSDIERMDNVNSIAVRKILSKIVGRDPARGRGLIEELKYLLKIYSSSSKFLCALTQILEIERRGEALAVQELKISGGELAEEVGLRGKEIGQAQQLLLQVVLQNPAINERVRLIHLALLMKENMGKTKEELRQELVSAAQQRDRDRIYVQVPEFAGLDRSQNNPHHRYNMDEHTFELISILARDPAVSSKLTDEIFLAALLHDIAKPLTETPSPDGQSSQYLGHEEKGGREVAPLILTRLGMPEGDPKRALILALIEQHMDPVKRIELVADRELTDKALGRFVREVMEPIGKVGIDLEGLLAFGRADILSSQGEDIYRRYGIPEGDFTALTGALDKIILGIKERINAYYSAQQQDQAKRSALSGALQLAPEQIEALQAALASAGMEAGIIDLIILKIREGKSMSQIFAELGKSGQGRRIGEIKSILNGFARQK